MKKSVVIIIGLIYALSIVFVTLFGLKHQSFNEIIYVNQVEIIEEKASYMPDGLKYLFNRLHQIPGKQVNHSVW